MTYIINHFGHFYLTYLLFDLLSKASEARIINVSSKLHFRPD
jgi:NAD(P)-dependent dehydrogenase (short-subunit alcohol dehydrogenase family)